jgi:hypothetical protein
MVFTQTTFFDEFILPQSTQQINGLPGCQLGQGDACIDKHSQSFSSARKDPSFDVLGRASPAAAAAVRNPQRMNGSGNPSMNGSGNPSMLPLSMPGPQPKSYLVEISVILAIAFVAAVLAYTKPKIFADLFKIFIGYELIVLGVSVLLILILLGVYLYKPHM